MVTNEESGEALEVPPLPRAEWAGLERALGAEVLAALIGVSTSRLRRYAAEARSTPNDVAARLHHLALIVGDVSGSHNDTGIRQWFARPRTELGKQTPAAVLAGAWDPRDDGPLRVRELAAALVGAPDSQPNALTRAALRDAERGRVIRARDGNDLLTQLDDVDCVQTP